MAEAMAVISAHAADFVWRAGGTIAKYTRLGWDVQVLVLSLGVRGESADLWRAGEQTSERVAAVRRQESQRAAEALGCQAHFFDLPDYRMTITNAVLEAIAQRLRAIQPTIMLTHAARDPFNPDHPLVHQASLEARMLASVPGVLPDLPTIAPPRLYAFEPHQSEMSGFVPEILIDITEDFATKVRAMNCIPTQRYLIDHHQKQAELRAAQARRNWRDQAVRYAEAFQICVPIVSDRLP